MVMRNGKMKRTADAPHVSGPLYLDDCERPNVPSLKTFASAKAFRFEFT
jgi:hypothetical protein